MEYQRTPLLFGDILLSAKTPDHKQIATVDELKGIPFTNPEYKVAGVRNKLILIRPTLGVGWTGGLLDALMVARELDDALTGRPSIRELQGALTKYYRATPPRLRDVRLVGVLISNGVSTIFRWNGETDEFSTGSFFVDGSGTDGLHEQIGKTLSAGTLNLDADLVGQRSHDDSVRLVLGRVGFFLGEEILLRRNLPDHFGGGFDIVFFDGHQLRRVASFCLLPVDATLIKHSTRNIEYDLQFRATSFWQSWHNGLVTSRIDFESQAGTFSREEVCLKIKSRSSATAQAFPVDQGEHEPERPRYIGFYQRLLAADAAVASQCIIYRTPSEDVAISEKDNLVRIRLSQNFHDHMNKSVHDALADEKVIELIRQAAPHLV